MSDTPRTDQCQMQHDFAGDAYNAMITLCRTLERENAALRHQVSNREREIADLRSRLAEAERRAEYWKAEHLAGNRAIEQAERAGMERAAKALNSMRFGHDTTHAKSYDEAIDQGIDAIRALIPEEADRG